MGRAPCCESKEGSLQLKKGAWTAEEDEKLVSFIRENNGHGSWRTLPQLAGLQRCGKSCRLRWTNYLRPNIKRGNFTSDEEWTITHLHALLGNKWSSIASHLPGRTDNEVKNHWNTHLKKRLSRIGIDPVTHRPMSLSLGNFNNINNEIKDDSMIKHSKHNSSITCNHQSQKKALPKLSVLDRSYVSHMAQWELARVEAEGRQSMHGKASASSVSSSSSDCTKGPGCSAGIRAGQGIKENDQLMEMIFEELLEAAPLALAPALAPALLPRLDAANSSSCSAGSQFINEADITSDLTSLICNMSPLSPADPSQLCDHNPLTALLPASPALAPSCEPSSSTYWANMLSLVAPSFPLAQLVDASVLSS